MSDRLPPWVLDDIDDMCREVDMSRTEFVTGLLTAWAAEQQDPEVNRGR